MENVKLESGKFKLASILGIPDKPVKLYPKVDTTANSTRSVVNSLRIIGGFGNHKLLFVYEIPASTCYDLRQRLPASKADKPVVFVYDFGNQVNMECNFPMKFVLYRLSDSPFIHFRSVLSNGKEIEDIVAVFREIKNSTLTVSIINEQGRIIQPEKLACCQRGPKGGLCFRIKDFLSLDDLRAEPDSFLTTTGSLIFRIQFIGSNLFTPELGSDSHKTLNEYDSDTKYRNLLYQLVRDEEFNSFLRSWASNTKFANVKIRIQDKHTNVTILPAHRVLLYAQSDSLGGYLKPNEDVVILEGFHHFTLLVMLDYIYSGEIHCNDLVTLVNLAELGDKLKVFGLKGKCIRDITMMFNNTVTNVKHIAACYKLGEILKTPALIDKAVECFRIMKHCEECIDFPYAKALMGIAGTKDSEEFQQILNSLYEKSSPSKEIIRNLIQYPADEVRLLGTSSESWTGYIYVIPGSMCTTMAEVCSHLNEPFSLMQRLEIDEGFFELVKNSENGMNLRVTSTVEDFNITSKNKGFQDHVKSLGINRADYLSIIAESIGVILKASLFDASGRIITACQTRGILVGGNYEFWEINSFITPNILKEWRRGAGEVLLRISFGTIQHQPTLRNISINHDNYRDFRKYDERFMETVNTDPYTARLVALFGEESYSDASISVVDDNKTSLFRTSVHAIILSAMSPQFEKRFTISPQLKLNANSYSIETIETFLKYIYGEDISIDHIGLALELISAAETFDIKGLQDKCIDKLCSCQLDLETCIHLYEIGTGTCSIPLKDIAIKFFRRNRSTVSKFKEFNELTHRYPKITELINTI